MFRDTKRELERLERELLAEEEPEEALPEDTEDFGEETFLSDSEDFDEEAFLSDAEDFDEEAFFSDPEDFDGQTFLDETENLDDESPDLYQNYSNGYGRKRSVRAYNSDNTDTEELSDALRAPEKSGSGLTAIVCLLLLAIAGVLIWCVLRFLG